jgi:hypothetical protein
MTLVTVTTNSTLIVDANAARMSLLITNNGDYDLYLGPTSSVETAGTNAGVKIVADGSYAEDGGSKGMYNGPFYGIAGSAATNVAYWERTR